MAESKYKVTYISNVCGDADELSNQPHESVANSLYELLINHSEITHPVIGLEGSWGSGKSQVINILKRIIRENNQSDKFCFITYDIWGAQEDLTRRSFLDSILSKSKKEDQYFKTDILKEDYAKLNATSITRKQRTFPSIRLFYAIVLLIPISTFLINSIEAAFGYNINALLTYEQLKGFIHIALAVLSLITLIFSYLNELKAINHDTNKKNCNAWEKFKIILGRILYFFKEKDIEKEDYETIITDEPSVSRFQNTFNHIYTSLKSDKKLIIVFDNMDRLSDPSKLMSTWSLLHTFFAEEDYNGKIWAIVPYAKQQLNEVMADKESDKIDKTTEFINKTFFTTFRIPEPIMGSWKSFLYNKLDQAFTPAIESDDKTLIALIFSRSMVHKQVRPRDIIVYVNKLVSLYSQHYFEEIPIAAIAIYAQYENEFSSPLKAILSFNGFESLSSLFEDKNKLSGWLSSIYYNLPSKDAIEVAYERSITAFLQSDYEIIGDKDEKEEAYKELSSQKAFKHYIDEFFNAEPDYASLKMENVFYLLDKSEITSSTRHKIYENIANQIQMLKDQFSVYEAWMEYGLLTCAENDTNTIIDTLIKESLKDFESYSHTVVELLRIKEKRNSLKLRIKPYKIEDAKKMINFASYLKEERLEKYYPKTKISIDVSKLLEYMKEGATTSELFGDNTDYIYDLLLLLRSHNVNLSQIENAINTASIQINTMSTDNVARIYKVFNIINTHITSVPSYTSTSSTAAKHIEIPEYLACVLHKLISSNANATNINTILVGDLPESSKSICTFITKYVSTDNLFKIALSSNNRLLKQLLELYISDFAKTIKTSGYLLGKTSEIIQSVIPTCENKFISLLDNNAEDIIKTNNIEWLNIDSYWINKINKTSIVEHVFLKLLHEKWLEGLKNSSKEDILTAFKDEESSISIYVVKLEEEGLLNRDFWDKTEVESAVKESFLGYIEDKNNLNIDLFDLWKVHMGESTKATLVNYVIDSITNPSSIEICKLYELVNLYIDNSQRLLEDKYSNSFFDDFYNRYVNALPIETLVQRTIERWEKINNYCQLLSTDRQEKLINLMTKRRQEIPEDSQGLTKWLSCIETLQTIVDEKSKNS